MLQVQADIDLRSSAEKKSMVLKRHTVIIVYVYTHEAWYACSRAVPSCATVSICSFLSKDLSRRYRCHHMLPMPSVECLTVKAWLRQLLMLMLQEDIGL
jgi:hypothetical protein